MAKGKTPHGKAKTNARKKGAKSAMVRQSQRKEKRQSQGQRRAKKSKAQHRRKPKTTAMSDGREDGPQVTSRSFLEPKEA